MSDHCSSADSIVVPFHEMCDNKPVTLVVFKIVPDDTLVAFVDKPWKAPDKPTFVASDGVFFYSLKLNQKFAVAPSHRDKALCHFKFRGPSFGNFELSSHHESEVSFKTLKGSTFVNSDNVSLREAVFNNENDAFVEDYEVFELK